MASRSMHRVETSNYETVESTVRETLPDGTVRVKTTIHKTTPGGGTYTEEKITIEQQRGGNFSTANSSPPISQRQPGQRRPSRFNLSKLFQSLGDSNNTQRSIPNSQNSPRANLTSFAPDQPLSLAQYRQQLLRDHNAKRAKHNSYDLVISEKLNTVAQEWAERLASMNRMQHRPASGYGENVFMAYNSAGTIPASHVTDSWYDEIRQYNYDHPSPGCGHFTQVVWKESKEVGFGRAVSKDGKTYVVANYLPPGNILGKFKENVTRPSR